MWMILALAVLGADDPDAPVATAPSRLVAPEVVSTSEPSPSQSRAPSIAHGLTTEQQIDRWLATRPRDDAPVTPFPENRTGPRKLQGEVSAAIGTGGYRDFGASVVAPIGENATLGFSYSQTENGYGAHRYGDIDPFFADGGYAFPGATARGRSLDYERRLARPDGPPNLRSFDIRR